MGINITEFLPHGEAIAMTTKIAFDDKAHSIISELLDTTEDWLVRHGECEPQSANDRLAYDYIIRCSDMNRGANIFLFHDERMGTQIFISELRGSRTKLRSAHNRRSCTAQLMQFQQIYFRNYLVMLRVAFLRELERLNNKHDFVMSGIFKLAAANLPGVRTDLRRKLRSLGLEYDALLVPDDTLERQQSRYKPGLFTIEG